MDIGRPWRQTSPMTAQDVAATGFGAVLRRFRSARRMSQLDLANVCEVSARHLSFLESGRAQPSRDMVMQLGAGLLLPLSARNALLLAAGFAPVFPSSPLQSEALGPFRAVLDEMIARHDPNPAFLVDRHWTVREANATARAFLAVLQGDGAEMNIPRLLTTSDRAAQSIANLPEVLGEITSRLQLEALEAGDDPVFADLLAALERACARYPQAGVRPRRPVLPLELDVSGARLRFLSVIAHFGTSEDVTVRDLRLELMFPADGETREAVKRLANRMAD
jgi:transcriptional regulator with XRE-family HTH domain